MEKLAASGPLITYRQSFASHSTCSLQHDYYSRGHTLYYVVPDIILQAYKQQPITAAARSSPARTLGSWVRIPLQSWMSVLGSSLATGWSPVQGVPPTVLDLQTEVKRSVLRCPTRILQVGATERADPPSKESYRLCIGLRNWKRDNCPTKGLQSHRRIECNIVRNTKHSIHNDTQNTTALIQPYIPGHGPLSMTRK
jgi:hypothetical protein